MKKRKEWIALLIAVLLIVGTVVLVNASSGSPAAKAVAEGLVITKTEGVRMRPASEPWIAFRKAMGSGDWEYLGTSERALTEETVASIRTVILCEGDVGANAQYKGSAGSGIKASEKVTITYIDRETRSRLGRTVDLAAQALPEKTNTLSAARYSNSDVLKAIGVQVGSGLTPGFTAPGTVAEGSGRNEARVAAVPDGNRSFRMEDTADAQILYLPGNVREISGEAPETLWFMIAESGSAAAGWAEEHGVPYCEDGSGCIRVPEGTDADRLAFLRELAPGTDSKAPALEELGIGMLRLPDGMAPEEDLLAGSPLLFVAGEGSMAETALRSAGSGEKDASYAWPSVAAGEDALAVRKGDRVLFGRYESDGNEADGPEAIPWNVLTVHGDEALLLCAWVLGEMPYGDTDAWESSPVRAWLNGGFLEGSFTEEERDALLRASEDKNKRFLPSGGGDPVFLLGSREAEIYGAAGAYASPALAAARGDEYRGEESNWWLRGRSSANTRLRYRGEPGVRPAVWVRLRSAALIAENTPAAPADPAAQTALLAAAASSLKAGDTVRFGLWEQDGLPGAREIEWTVLEVNKGKALLLSRLCLDAGTQADWHTYSSWDSSDLRTRLNSDFLNGAFTSEQRRAIVRTAVNNKNEEGSADWYSSETAGTKDCVFLLSVKDALERYFASDADRVALATAEALYEGAAVENGGCRWWLRSKGGGYSAFAAVDGSGRLSDYDAQDTSVGIRPAMWIDLGRLGGSEG